MHTYMHMDEALGAGHELMGTISTVIIGRTSNILSLLLVYYYNISTIITTTTTTTKLLGAGHEVHYTYICLLSIIHT